MRKFTVLIVEDVAEMRELLALVLGELPDVATIAKAANTTEARHMAAREMPDFVFLDEVLPGESSVDLLREFYSLGIRVFLMSASTGSERPPAPSEACGRLEKPVWGDEMAARSRFAQAMRQYRSGSS